MTVRLDALFAKSITQRNEALDSAIGFKVDVPQGLEKLIKDFSLQLGMSKHEAAIYWLQKSADEWLRARIRLDFIVDAGSGTKKKKPVKKKAQKRGR